MYLKTEGGYINLDKCAYIILRDEGIQFNYSGSDSTVLYFDRYETAEYVYKKLWGYIRINKNISVDEILINGEVK